VYAATSGGVIAAVRLAMLGRSVVVIEPSRHVGGMTTGGLGWIDFGRADSIGGLTRRYFDAIRAHYTHNGVLEGNGWAVEPHVAEELFEKWIAEHKIEVIREARIASVKMDRRRIASITLDKALVDSRGAPAKIAAEPDFLTIAAAMFIDCSYEGDLMAKAGVRYRTDREARDEHNESLAGVCFNPTDSSGAFGYTDPQFPVRSATKIDPYRNPADPSSGVLPLISTADCPPAGTRHPAIQAYNFRLCLTQDNPIPIAAPSDYDPSRYELVHRYIKSLEIAGEPLWPGDIYEGFGHERRHGHARLLKITKLVRGKTDVNNAGSISMDYVTGGSERYAEATWAERAQLWHAHEDYQRGFLYFLRTDARLPEWLRNDVASWGLPRDEFKDTGGWPTQLYIREARRMVGVFVIKQGDCEKPAQREESIGLGAYSLDSHLCQRLVRDGRVVNEGGFFHRINSPYPIPYSVITPREQECENLLVTFCVSSTHAAFASFRMEPPFMILCESAAFATDAALRKGSAVQGIDPQALARTLKDAGQRV